MNSIEDRLAQLERRVEVLEEKNAVQLATAPDLPPLPAPPEEPLVALAVSNKRYDPGEYESHIWFDCVYTLSSRSKPTRAVKGLIEFADLFGDVKFRLHTTINEPLAPNRPLTQKGIGFSYNQFMGEHQWMLVTNLSDMRCSFRPTNAIYTDGTAETYP